MKKLLVLAAVVVLFCSGCVDEKAAETENPILEAVQYTSDTQPQQTEQPQADEQGDEPSTSGEIEDSEVGDTQETLEELSGLLEDLKDSDFADIEFAE